MKLSEITQGGLVVAMDSDGSNIYCNTEDTHSFILGATRSGKSRTIVLPSIGVTALAGESMIIVDPKGELYAYTHPFLERLGYEVLALDYVNQSAGIRYNYLQPVIDKINSGKIHEAISAAQDIAEVLVPQGSTNETLWSDGARSIITMAILAVVYDNKTAPQYQNLSNAQQFITYMCEPVGKKGELPLVEYLTGIPDDHPAKIALGISNIAPSKMRASFYAQALTTLNLFASPAVHSMTNFTDFDIYRTGDMKRAVFIILPDEKTTFHPLAALFVSQHYQTLVDYARNHGNRLNRRVHFFCDEFGNFVKIPDMSTMITVAGGRGIKFHLFLQDVQQLDGKYRDEGKTVRGNCETWIYLYSKDGATLKELSESLGSYTIKSPSLSGSANSSSASFNLTGRKLLFPEEIEKIDRPYQLVAIRGKPAVAYCPDISKTIFNRLFGMGDKEHNRRLIIKRMENRPLREPDVHYWGIWHEYKQIVIAKEEKDKERQK